MKKVMIGILILIPILILVIVALVSSIVSIQAWISVEDIQLRYKGTENVAENISFNFENVANKTINLYDYIDVKVLPEKQTTTLLSGASRGTSFTQTTSIRQNTRSTSKICPH